MEIKIYITTETDRKHGLVVWQQRFYIYVMTNPQNLVSKTVGIKASRPRNPSDCGHTPQPCLNINFIIGK